MINQGIKRIYVVLYALWVGYLLVFYPYQQIIKTTDFAYTLDPISRDELLSKTGFLSAWNNFFSEPSFAFFMLVVLPFAAYILLVVIVKTYSWILKGFNAGQ